MNLKLTLVLINLSALIWSCDTKVATPIKEESYALEITKNENLTVNEGYELTLSPNVRINVGGAFYNKTRNEIKDGTSAGGLNLTKEQIQKIEANIGQMWQLEINKYGTLNLREMAITNLNTKEKTKGLYNTENRIFLTGNAASESYNNGKCGTIGLGLVKGKVSVDGNAVSDGEISFTLLTGCNPIAVGVNITYYFTAKRIGNGTGIPFIGGSGTWNVPQSATLLSQSLIAKRWKFVFYANNGNVIKPTENDFVQFYEGGELGMVVLGNYEKAKWKYNETNKSIEVTNSQGFVTNYFIQNLSEKGLQVYTPNDEYGYEAVEKPKVAIANTLSERTKLLSSAPWKLQSIRAGILTPSPKVNDFAYFYPDGSYEHAVFGIYAKGSWKWENAEKRISITSTAGPMARNVISISDKKLELLDNNEGGVFIR